MEKTVFKNKNAKFKIQFQIYIHKQVYVDLENLTKSLLKQKNLILNIFLI